MNALDQARSLYTPDLGRTLEDDIAAFAATGYVFITPIAVLLCKPVPIPHDEEIIDYGDPWKVWPATQWEAWYVWLGAGDIRELLRLTPFPLKYLAFARRDVIKVYGFENATRHILCTTSTTAPLRPPGALSVATSAGNPAFPSPPSSSR